jgi:hypothetical protein
MRYVIIALLHLATMTTADAQWFRQSGGTCANGSCSQGSGVQFASPTIPPFSAGLTAAEPVNRLVWEFKAGDKSTLVLKVDGYTFGELNTRTLVFTGARGEKWDLSDAIPRTIPQAMPGKKDAGQPCKGFAGTASSAAVRASATRASAMSSCRKRKPRPRGSCNSRRPGLPASE